MKNFPKYTSHEAAAQHGCFNCGSELDKTPINTGYPEGCFSQKCTGRCGMNTYYDLKFKKPLETEFEAAVSQILAAQNENRTSLKAMGN